MYDVNKPISDLECLLEEGFSLSYVLNDISMICENEFKGNTHAEEYFYHDYVLRIYANSECVHECVGEVEFKLFNTSSMDMLGETRFDIFDSIDAECSELGSILEYDNRLKDEYENAYCVLYIEKLLINKNIRNNGIAHRVLSQIYDIVDWYLSITPNILIFKSFPIEVEIDYDVDGRESKKSIAYFNKMSDKLNKLYLECGFEYIKDDDSTYFYKIC